MTLALMAGFGGSLYRAPGPESLQRTSPASTWGCAGGPFLHSEGLSNPAARHYPQQAETVYPGAPLGTLRALLFTWSLKVPLRGRDSNPQPSAYEADERPSLCPAKTIVSEQSRNSQRDTFRKRLTTQNHAALTSGLSAKTIINWLRQHRKVWTVESAGASHLIFRFRGCQHAPMDGLLQLLNVHIQRPRGKFPDAYVRDLFRDRGNRIDRPLTEEFGKGRLVSAFRHIHAHEAATADGMLRHRTRVSGVAEDFHDGPGLGSLRFFWSLAVLLCWHGVIIGWLRLRHKASAFESAAASGRTNARNLSERVNSGLSQRL
jgi:hypothetical protein